MLDLLCRNLRLLGVLAITISLITWWIDLAGWVTECIYCRSQRTAIGLVGIAMVLPDPRRWWVRYGAAAICFFGASIAVDQIFLVLRNIAGGRPFSLLNVTLAAAALFILIGQALLLFLPKPARR